MSNLSNYIEVVTRDNDTFIAALNDRICVNNLTGALVGRTQSYLASKAKNALQLSPEDINNIDNFEDDREDPETGETLDQKMTRLQGGESQLFYRDMVILNGLRHHVYEDLFRFCEVARPEQALYSEPPASLTGKPNYDQPMSVERFLEFIVKQSGKVNEKEYADAIKEQKDAQMYSEQSAADLRLIFQEQANRRQGALNELRSAIFLEIRGLPSSGIPTSEFANLEGAQQIALVNKHVKKLQEKHAKLLPFRTPEHASNRAAIVAEINVFQTLANDMARAARHLDV